MGEDWILSPQSENLFTILQKTGIVSNLLHLVFPFYGKANKFNPSDFRFYAIGQSHLDTCWNWTWFWTKRKIYNTFNNALRHMDEYPDFKFSGSAPVHYEYFEKAYPTKFKKIQQYVKEGRWDIVGGMYCEPDGNVPDGESLVRQRLIGQKYYLSRFNKRSMVAWVPDSFGFTYSYPQIYKKSGTPYFHTTKLTWNLEHEFPFALFWWEGPDGSRVLGHNIRYGFRALEKVGEFKEKTRLIPEGKESPIYNYAFDFERNDIRTKDFVKDFAHTYGFGDGGAGPLLPELLIPVNLKKRKSWQIVRAAVYYKMIQRDYGKRLPVWKDELYLEVHRGCQTTFYSVKKKNRIIESLLPKMEKLAILTSVFDRSKEEKSITFPLMDYKLLEICWKKLLFNQFHDILPGTSIEEVYVDTHRDYDYVIEKMEEYRVKIENNISKLINNFDQNSSKQLIFNPNHWEGKILSFNNPTETKLDINQRADIVVIRKPKGIGFQIIDGENIENINYTNLRIGKTIDNTLEVTKNGFKIKFNMESASISSLKTNINGQEIELADYNIDENRFGINKLKLFIDEPKGNDAWNLNPDYRNQEMKVIEVMDYKIFEADDEHPFVEIKFELKLSKSKAILSYIIHNSIPYIIVHLDLDYQEHRKLLRVEFDTTIESDKIINSLAYGMIERPTQPKTPLEKGRWEFPGQKFISLSNQKHGISVLCENRYGFHSEGKSFGISLKKSPLYGNPDGFMNVSANCTKKNVLKNAAIPKEKRKEIKDLGLHSMRWAIYPHEGNWIDAKVYQEFFNLTENPVIFNIKPKSIEPEFNRLIDCDLENIRISAVKSEYNKDTGIVIRLFEFQGIPSKGKLYIHPKLIGSTENIEIFEADLLEGRDFIETIGINKNLHYDQKMNVIEFEINKFEIKTIIIRK